MSSHQVTITETRDISISLQGWLCFAAAHTALTFSRGPPLGGFCHYQFAIPHTLEIPKSAVTFVKKRADWCSGTYLSLYSETLFHFNSFFDNFIDKYSVS